MPAPRTEGSPRRAARRTFTAMQDDLTPRLQRSLGDAFTIERELGGGGMSRVFLATDRALDRRVVVKVLDLEGTVAASAERFRREIKLIAQLQHPHIVPVLTAGGDDTLLWYVMPYVAGESLRARLVREGALPLADALRIARELLDALAFAHDHGIVHRDVKPENILLEGRHAVVADFGVAKALSDAGVSEGGLTSIGLALGTPAYMAPEQAMADATTNHRADLYASGAVLYEMLAGAPPYSGNAQAVVAAHLTAPVPRIEERRTDVPLAVAALIARLMAKNPAERPQSAHEVAVSLESVTTPVPSLTATSTGTSSAAATAQSVAPRAGARGRRGIAAAALLVVIASALWWRSRADAAPVVDGADIIAVMPFGSTGDTASGRLGRDLVVTMSANLDGVGSLRAVDAMSVLQRAQLLPQPVPLDAARKLGAELGARSVLHGSLVREGAQVRAEVGLYPVDGGEALARFSVLGAPDSLRALTDSLSASLLRAIWRSGKAPSPLLSEVTTANGEALRAFLAGERAFQRAATMEAIEAYHRAVVSDSLFAQAWLRLDYSRSLAVLPPDTMVRRHLLGVMGRLPARDRELLELRLTTGLTLRQRIDSGRILAARYPDYHTAQYQVGDNIIHGGPLVGIPITDALPYLERLELLAPNHADNALHRMMVSRVLGDTAATRSAAKDLIARSPGEFAPWGARVLLALDARASGRSVSSDSMLANTRSFFEFMKVNSLFTWFPSSIGGFGTPLEQESSIAVARRAGLLAGRDAPLLLAEGALDVSRGNVARGVERLSALETAAGEIPPEVRLTAVRSAAHAAWFGTLPVAEADAALARARKNLVGLSGTNAMELSWADGIIAIAAGDSLRLARAVARIADTTAVRTSVARGLRALWRERRTGAIDSLLAADDDAMVRSTTFSSAIALTRAAIGRGLVRGNDPARAEQYLQWTDAVVNGLRSTLVLSTGLSYNSYDRGLAREAAGDRTGAILHLQRFVEMMDQPPPALRQQVDDAKLRLRRLAAQDR